jgi:thiol-disulfide isomerase/thioredoxin/TolA-binding protein
MMKDNLKHALYTILLLISCSAGQVLAQIPHRTGPASADEIKKAQAVVEANPDSLKAYEAYVYALGISSPGVEVQYNVLIKKYPKKAVIPLAFGTVYHNAEMPEARRYLLDASALEPNNARIWAMLASDAWIRGQNDLSAEYKKKAMLADPSNEGYAAGYLMPSDDTALDYTQKVLEFIKRFPASEYGASALYWLGENATNVNDKINYFEELRKLYPPQKFSWSAAGMTVLADVYLQANPETALALINEMGDGKNWLLRKQVAESLIKINKLEQDKNYKAALILLNQLQLPEYNKLGDFIPLKKSDLLARSGDVKAAYDSLAVKFAKLPSDHLDSTLAGYGEEIGKDKQQVEKDVRAIRYSKAVAAYPFSLGLYTSNANLSLNDLKGKVVLLTFWFPDCSPCRDEFPHFQAVIDKFKDKNVAYVGIDVSPFEDPFVAPFLSNSKYSFIPLRGNSDFAEKYYGVQGEPENFLIDQDGKIIFKDFRIDGSNHRTLELMITSLLDKGQQKN